MFDYIKMILSVIANVTRNTTVNLQKKKTPNESEFLIFNALCAIVTCLALIVFCKGIHPISLYSFWLSVSTVPRS